jgi:hypothetical protein
LSVDRTYFIEPEISSPCSLERTSKYPEPE